MPRTAPAMLIPDVPPPPTTPTDLLYEVVEGRAVEKPPMGAFECWLANVLARVLGTRADAHHLGRVVVEMIFDLRLILNRERRPDVAFVSAERWPLDQPVPRTASWAVVSDSAVEIVSPTNGAAEILGKVHEYFQVGVRRVWVIYPDPGEVYDYESPTAVRFLTGADALDGGSILPGFRLALVGLFEATA